MTFFWEGWGGRTFERGWTSGLSLPSWTFVQYPLPGQYILMWIANVLDVMQMEERAESMSREPITWCFPWLLYRHNLLVLFFFSKKLVSLPPLPRVLLSSWDMHKSGVFQPTSTSGSFMVPRFGREKNCRDAITQRPFYQSLQRFQDKGKSEAKKIVTLNIKTQFFICRWINLRCPVAKISCCWYA